MVTKSDFNRIKRVLSDIEKLQKVKGFTDNRYHENLKNAKLIVTESYYFLLGLSKYLSKHSSRTS